MCSQEVIGFDSSVPSRVLWVDGYAGDCYKPYTQSASSNQAIIDSMLFMSVGGSRDMSRYLSLWDRRHLGSVY